MRRFLRYLWALPGTLVGGLAARAARGSGGAMRQVEGVLDAAGGWPAWVLRHGFPFRGPVAAITLGHVVLGVLFCVLASTRVHVRAHVRQFERWGVLLLMLYPLSGLLAWVRGGNPYRDNLFEREARLAEAAGQGVSGRSRLAGDQSTGR